MALPVTGAREHLQAVDAIVAAGGDPNDSETYLEAVQAAAVNFDEMLREVGGFPDMTGDLVTPELLKLRMNEILTEQGYDWSNQTPGGYAFSPTEAAIKQAVRQAVQELGQVGDKRKDADRLSRARHEQLVDEAVRSRRIPNAQAATWLAQLERDPENIAAVLAKLPVDPHLDSLADVRGDRVILVDDESLVIANRADDLVVARGQATRDPHTGALVGCSHGDYTQALIDVEKAMKAEAEKAAQAA